eukprot:1315043-Amorphochlora_amoeboformis.AAC.2
MERAGRWGKSYASAVSVWGKEKETMKDSITVSMILGPKRAEYTATLPHSRISGLHVADMCIGSEIQPLGFRTVTGINTVTLTRHHRSASCYQPTIHPLNPSFFPPLISGSGNPWR